MLQTSLMSVLLYGLGTAIAFAFATLALGRTRRRLNRSGHVAMPEDLNLESFVFRRTGPIMASFPARRQLDRLDGDQDDRARLRRLLVARFDDVDALLSDPGTAGEISRVSRDGALQIERLVAGDQVRLDIRPRDTDLIGPKDLGSIGADADELRLLRANTANAPFLLWRQNAAGQVTWANRAYVSAASDILGDDRMAVWPLPSIFPTLGSQVPSEKSRLRRIQPEGTTGDQPAWYDCHMTEIEGETLCTAFRADEAVRSETRRLEFTQTLTTTFSDLAIGLAIFDKSRKLKLFNPALTDLTSLAADFLIARPSLLEFLDRLRENCVMPEPRDYRSWRKSMSDLELAASDGTYSETWSLPDGRTYRVSGHPHPDGAIAFLFEDISAEMSLTRRFRAQLEQSQSVIDALDDAIAIFSSTGELTFSNAAYDDLWEDPARQGVLGSSVIEATRTWHALSVPTPVWGDFRDFAFQDSERDEWTAEVSMRDGRKLACRFVPQKAGASLAIFHLLSRTPNTAEALRRTG